MRPLPLEDDELHEFMCDTVRCLSASVRFPLKDEAMTQIALNGHLTGWFGTGDWGNVSVQDEVTLGRAGRIDFVLSKAPHGLKVGIEVKLKMARRSILDQLHRYALSQRLNGLVLLTATPINLPPFIEGVPVESVSLGRAWL